MISQSAEGRGRRASYGGRGRGRTDSSGRGRGQRPPVSNGEARGQFGQQWPESSIGQQVQPVTYDSPPPGFPLESSKTSQGVVVALLDSYGFIRPPGGQAQIFFHGSEVQNVSKIMDEQFDLRELLQLGDEVSFEIKQVAHKEKKVNAIKVNKLSKGTIAALQSAERGNYRGTIHTLPGESSWRSKDVTPGKIAFTQPALSPDEATEQFATFKPADLQEKAVKLRIGDKVEFSLVQQEDASIAGDAATGVVLLHRAASAAAGDGGQLQGCVISVKEGFGFIRPAARATDRIYFRLSDVVGGHTQQVALNSEVSYVMVPDPRGNQDRAANVQILNTKFVADQLSMLPGMGQGRVIQPPAAPASEQQLDGVLVYNEGQHSFNCSFGAFQVSGQPSLQEDDEVSFAAGVNVATGARKATSVQLLVKADGQSARRELGQVITMRTQFGFIKCCERPGEMFFHFSALDGGPEAFSVGDDVEFSITREPKGERLNAVEIIKATQGSAVFETVSEEQFSGRVVDRIIPPRGYNAVTTSGLLAYEAKGDKQQLPFDFGDLQDNSLNPGSGDKVTFKVATNIATAKAAEMAAGPNSKYAGRRAVGVTPVAQEGMTVSITGSSGLIEFSQDQPYDIQDRDRQQRIPFQISEVQDSADNLKPSDIVSFVLQTDSRSKERQAARITRLKGGDGVVPEETQRKNPNAMKFTGGSAGGSTEGVAKAKANQAVRIARGPDGTRGFTAALQPGGRARLLPPPAPIPPETAAVAPGSAGPHPAASRSASGNSPVPNISHMPHSDANSPARSAPPGQQPSVQSKGRGQASKAGRGRGQGTANGPASSPAMPTPRILQPPSRELSASPVPRGASPVPIPTSAPATNSRGASQGASPPTNPRKPKASLSGSQGLHRQAVMSQAARQQPQQAADAQPKSQKPQGNVLAAANGQSSIHAAPDSKAGVKASVEHPGPERTSSGRMLNPFASTFIPHTDSGSMLSANSQ